jgi:hypothetical protein
MLSPTLRYIHPLLEIPAGIQAQAFPDVSLSVLDFLQFPLPVISGTAPRHKPSEFFSSDPPTMDDIRVIQKIPIPPVKIVRELTATCKAALASGTKSVKCQHSPSASGHNLLVWVIPY